MIAHYFKDLLANHETLRIDPVVIFSHIEMAISGKFLFWSDIDKLIIALKKDKQPVLVEWLSGGLTSILNRQ